MKTVSFDFDGILEHEEVQQYAKYLMACGVDIFVITARLDELHLDPHSHYGTNEDLFEVTRSLGIPKHQVIFTNEAVKGKYFNGIDKIIWHLDNSWDEISSINSADTSAIAIHKSGEWKSECNDLLNIE